MSEARLVFRYEISDLFRLSFGTLVPRPTSFFALRFALAIIHRSRIAAKNKAWENSSHEQH